MVKNTNKGRKADLMQKMPDERKQAYQDSGINRSLVAVQQGFLVWLGAIWGILGVSFTENDTLTIATVCGFKKMITVKNVNVPSVAHHFLDNDTIVCKEGILLQPGITGSSYLWQGLALPGRLCQPINPDCTGRR